MKQEEKINIALHFQQILHLDATSTGKVVAMN